MIMTINKKNSRTKTSPPTNSIDEAQLGNETVSSQLIAVDSLSHLDALVEKSDSRLIDQENIALIEGKCMYHILCFQQPKGCHLFLKSLEEVLWQIAS